ncbi:hypothetical protein DN051_01715 [Streptomyces cadmiisoli]|uniref:Uncharacterized protein n=1 Tax=Streptomyces cadmiisoli TaxID=2184053 RepID=A0A2Z4ISM3_9ACTN|nr:hypothetical protein DN051_01715 [Streptomyces cadmiisoli]
MEGGSAARLHRTQVGLAQAGTATRELVRIQFECTVPTMCHQQDEDLAASTRDLGMLFEHVSQGFERESDRRTVHPGFRRPKETAFAVDETERTRRISPPPGGELLVEFSLFGGHLVRQDLGKAPTRQGMAHM